MDETVYFAYCYPYTLSMLKTDIDAILKDETRSQFITKKEELFTTMAGNKGEVLTITDPNSTEK